MAFFQQLANLELERERLIIRVSIGAKICEWVLTIEVGIGSESHVAALDDVINFATESCEIGEKVAKLLVLIFGGMKESNWSRSFQIFVILLRKKLQKLWARMLSEEPVGRMICFDLPVSCLTTLKSFLESLPQLEIRLLRCRSLDLFR